MNNTTHNTMPNFLNELFSFEAGKYSVVKGYYLWLNSTIYLLNGILLNYEKSRKGYLYNSCLLLVQKSQITHQENFSYIQESKLMKHIEQNYPSFPRFRFQQIHEFEKFYALQTVEFPLASFEAKSINQLSSLPEGILFGQNFFLSMQDLQTYIVNTSIAFQTLKDLENRFCELEIPLPQNLCLQILSYSQNWENYYLVVNSQGQTSSIPENTTEWKLESQFHWRYLPFSSQGQKSANLWIPQQESSSLDTLRQMEFSIALGQEKKKIQELAQAKMDKKALEEALKAQAWASERTKWNGGWD